MIARWNGRWKGEEEAREEEEAEAEEVKPTVDKYADSEKVLIKYERRNPTYEILGFTFTKRHPYAMVPTEVADYLVRKADGFRLALPSELTDFYN